MRRRAWIPKRAFMADLVALTLAVVALRSEDPCIREAALMSI